MDKKTSNKEINELRRDFILDFIVEPFLFAFTIYMLFSRLQAIIDIIARYPEYSFWAVWEVDIRMNLAVYISFFVVIAIWGILKADKSRRERAERKQLINMLDDLQKVIKDLPDKVAESIKSSTNDDNKSRG